MTLFGDEVVADPQRSRCRVVECPLPAVGHTPWCSRHQALPEAPRYDLAEGRRQSENAQARAEAGAGDGWRDQARDAIRRCARALPSLTADDVWQYGLERTRENRALGPQMAWAAREGLIRKTGRVRPATNVAHHAGPKYEYDSLVYRGAA